MQEAALMAQLKQKHIVNLIGVVTRGKPKMIVLQYCEHGALLDHLKQSVGFRALSLDAKLTIAGDVAEGMAYIASHHLIHRDLAARNVLVSADYSCKVADFGLSREVEGDADYVSQGGAVPVRWTAIEALEEHKYSEASDVWSFGIVVHEIFTHGETPYKGWPNSKVWMKVKLGYRLPQPEGMPGPIYRKV